MRTRFLPSNDAVRASVEALGFVQLPVPHFPPTDSSSFFFDSFLHCLDEIIVSPEIEKLPMDDALSIFLSDVLPHFIPGANYEGCKEICDGEKQVVRLTSGEKIQDEASFDNKCGNAIKFVQFEIPEMDLSLLPLENATCSQNDSSHIFSEISETESTLDMQRSELTLFDHLEIQQSVYSVDDMSTEYLTEQKADSLEDGYSIQVELHTRNHDFPLFEVDEDSMGIVRRIYVVDELLNFENIEKEELTPPAEEISNNKDLLGSKEFDFAKDLSNYCAAMKCLEDADFPPQLDDISIIDLSHLHEYSLFYDGRKQNDSISSMHPSFDEFLFIDLDLYNFHAVFLDVAKHMEPETCESMFRESMNFKNLNELIVSHELTLMDEYFKSLPVPILSDLRHIRPMHLLAEELFAQLEWQSSSASDGLYLDWHYLGEDGRDLVKYSSCWKMLWDIDTYNTNAALNLSVSKRLIFDFILYEDQSDKPTTETNKEMLNIPTNDIPIVHASSVKAEPTSSINHRHGQKINENFVQKNSFEKSLLFGESMSSDLEFFLNPRINITGREGVPASKSMDVNAVHQVLKSSDDSTASKATTTYEKKWDIQLHKVKLSDNIILLIDYLQKHFLALWENDEELIQIHNRIQAGDDLGLLQISKEELMCRINEKSDSATYIADKDDHIIILSVLYAIKQMAFYLCYYGVQATYVYIDKLIRNLPWVKSRLIFLYKLIRDEQEKAENELSIIHPSISILQEIIQRNSSKSSYKILIVADQVFWWPLEKLMTSLKISYNEPQCLAIHPSQCPQCSEIADSTVDIMLGLDCCLVSPDYVSASFPFSKFSLILEYGGSNVSSRVSSIFPKLDIFPTLYFVKVELVEPIARALSDCISMTKSIDREMKKAMGSTMGQAQCKSLLEDILNAAPVKVADGGNGHLKSVNEDEDCTMMPVQSIPVCSESKQNLPCKPFCPDTVIIVNTRNFNEEMVISRRSTYLRILKMEKQGSQVVERDISLPVDIIVSPAVSLTWYDSRNIGKKASALGEAFSCFPLFVESIAANILTSLSFAFSCCILIFEGEGSFLSSIMESSDELYAAAATLGIEIQLFCSYSSEMTEEIILSCIKGAAKLSNGLYPKMSDSESLAESFLNAFPSINPLSAHAILSSGETLGKFLELSNEGKISALNKYQVRDEIIALLNATSRYGEREGCKSGTTDCSSSVSSVPDSENIQFKSASERKKAKYTHDILDTNRLPDHMKSLNQLPDDHLNRTTWPVSHNSWLSSNSPNMAQTREAEMKAQPNSFDRSGNKQGQFNSSFDELFNFEKFDANGFETVEFDAKGFEISGDMNKTWIPVIDVECTPERRSAAAAMKNLIGQSMKVPDTEHDNYIGEVIDVDDTPSFWRKDYVVKQDYDARMATAPEMSFHANNHQAFTESASIDINNPLRCQRGPLEEDMTGNDPQDTNSLPFKRTRKSNSINTPLSNALHYTQTQQGSPWTIEFLNRIREKSRLRQLSVPCNLTSPSFVLPEKTSKFVKRKSPSIFEFYKYEGSTPNKIVDKRKLKRNSTPLKNSLKNERASASSMPQWTPFDKRARRTLSFSSNGSGGQSKLIWTDYNSHSSQRGF